MNNAKKALFYEKSENNAVKCGLCSHRCIIKDGSRGICAVRENSGGVLKTLVYGNIVSAGVDPIEKKPLFHFMPGTFSYSIAAVGCNFKCIFCQNSEISQMPGDNNEKIIGSPATPEEIVRLALQNNCKSISYTYTEPTVFFEFAYETALLAHKNGIKNVFVTNGYITPQALNFISPFLDATNVDLKSFSAKFYKNNCSGKLEHVLETLRLMKSLGIFVEISTLIIPELNDAIKELQNMAQFIADDLGKETPWHISRFYPRYKMPQSPPTPLDTLLKAREIGIKAGLQYVYVGNIAEPEYQNTFCPSCGRIFINRIGYHIDNKAAENGTCPGCGFKIYGVYNE